MSENYSEILSHLSTNIDQETLLLYLQDKLSADKKHELEKQLLQDDFNEDALEGLQEVKDKEKIQLMVEMLNRELKKKTKNKKLRRERMKIKDQPWLYVSLLILIILLALSYIFIHKMLNG
jgi:hypothetical protein